LNNQLIKFIHLYESD